MKKSHNKKNNRKCTSKVGLREENYTWEIWRRLWKWRCVRVKTEWEWRGWVREAWEWKGSMWEWEWEGEWERHESGEGLFESERVSERGVRVERRESGEALEWRVYDCLILKKPYMKDSIFRWLPSGSTTLHTNRCLKGRDITRISNTRVPSRCHVKKCKVRI